ncbi:MAG: type II toxin-antitoxin system prevent-host-death family antitoxin [Burkholderiales bacterium]|nr:type II toxin-antitoxin system prevent-host-death family antitoxin [Burkholderiales bacterium]
METVKATQLRDNLAEYLARAVAGEEVAITSRGRIVARLVPAALNQLAASAQLAALRAKCQIGDIVSPVDADWNAQHGRS